MNNRKFEERQFIITSIIRLMSMICFDAATLNSMMLCSRRVRSIERDGGCISDEQLYKLYVMECEQ